MSSLVSLSLLTKQPILTPETINTYDKYLQPMQQFKSRDKLNFKNILNVSWRDNTVIELRLSFLFGHNAFIGNVSNRRAEVAMIAAC